MTQDEIKVKYENINLLAEEAGLEYAYPINHPMAKFIMAITARAEAKEREACAKLCEEYAIGLERNYSEIIADKIRARGEQA